MGETPMKLVHYSSKPLSTFVSVPLPRRLGRDGQPVGDKPRGLWVSDEDAEQNWRTWCQGEGFGLDCFKFSQEISLHAHANVLYIKDARGIDSFTNQYRGALYPGGREEYINWQNVCAQYQGIIITPYVWSRRLDGGATWYYSWDCASGVIWDGAAIAELGAPTPFEFARETVDG